MSSFYDGLNELRLNGRKGDDKPPVTAMPRQAAGARR
jgi:hypothetical protein